MNQCNLPGFVGLGNMADRIGGYIRVFRNANAVPAAISVQVKVRHLSQWLVNSVVHYSIKTVSVASHPSERIDDSCEFQWSEQQE